MCRNVYYLVLGVLLGAVLGIFICDETKKKITKAVQNRAKLLSDSFKSSSDKAMHTVKSSVKDYFN